MGRYGGSHGQRWMDPPQRGNPESSVDERGQPGILRSHRIEHDHRE